MRRILPLALVIVGVICANAQASPPGPEPVLYQAYGTGEWEYSTVFPCPPADIPCKTVVTVPGGWYAAQNHEEIGAQPDMELLQRVDHATVIEIHYPGLPAPFWPKERRAVENAVLWAQSHALSYGGDPANIELWGLSAGADVALNASDNLAVSHPGLVKSISAWSGPGLNETTFTQQILAGDSPSGAIPTAFWLDCHWLDRYADCTEANAIERSPYFHIPSPCVPTQLVYTYHDFVVDPSQSEEYGEALEAAGCNPTITASEGTGHSIALFWKDKVPFFNFEDEH